METTMNRKFLALLILLSAMGGGLLVYLALQRDASRTGAAIEVNLEGTLSWVVGSADAPIEVLEANDYQCPDCKEYDEVEMPAIKARFIDSGQVRWRYLLFALPGHDDAIPAAHAMGCAMEQGDSLASRMHAALFASQATWARQPGARDSLRVVAERAGVDLASWDGCTASNRYMEAIAQGWRAAQAAGVPGTPTLVLFDRFYVGGLTANQLGRVLEGGGR
jgi:protein-disulfide isomerase